MPALDLIIDSVIFVTASSCPMTRLWSCLSRWSVFSLSVSVSFATGIPVHLDIILAISSSVTLSLSNDKSLFLTAASSTSNCFWSCGNLPYWSSAAFSRLYSLWAFSMSFLTFSTCSLKSCNFVTESFSFSHCAFLLLNSSRISANSFWSSTNLSLLRLSVSFLSAASSISNCITFLLSSSSSVGIESISVLIKAHASSTKSIALSGRNLSVIYLSESVAALTNAPSWIFTPWKTSYLSFKPLKIEIVSSTVGSFTITGWNLLSKALSFSIYCLYSSNVVAPIQWSSPLASIGFNILPASIAPSVFPAPTIVWSSSINNIMFPSLFFTSSRTAFNLSSNSPLYLAPATRAPKSRANIFLSFSPSGTSPRTIRCANPSTAAVLPTPGSPINTGLFFVLRESILITFLISLSRPITGSSFWFLALSTKSCPYLDKASYVLSGLSDVTFTLPLTVSNASRNLSLLIPYSLNSSATSLLGLSINERKICSTDTYSSPILLASSSA